ncbi:hypothetical protein OF83DRAFT_1089262 [Amylostereum chailletii]|nr:hypothetical protein OF83DRAFT_1089262 [Amylostereum chailletii]
MPDLELVDDLEDIRDDILGPEDERGPSFPDDFELKGSKRTVKRGGTVFKRSGHAHPVHSGTWCYRIGTSYEQATSIILPARANKSSPGNEDLRGLQMCQDILKYGVRVGMAATRYLPEEIRAHMALQADLVNVPSIGTSDNVFWGNAQVNLSHADDGDAASPRTLWERYLSTILIQAGVDIGDLSSSLGFFGGGHKDTHDGVGGLTCMISGGVMPEGFFFLFELGVYIELSDFKMIFFSGLRQKAIDSAYRWALILYPPASILNNKGITALGTLRSTNQIREDAKKAKQKRLTKKNPEVEKQEQKAQKQSQGLLGISPEMKNKLVELFHPQDINSRAWSVHTTWAADGHIIMPGGALLNFVARMLLLLCTFILAQAYWKFQFQIDTDKFLSSFSMAKHQLPEPGQPSPSPECVVARTWTYAPHINDPEHDANREAAMLRVRAYEDKVIPLIPEAELHAQVRNSIHTQSSPVNWRAGGRPIKEGFKKKHDLVAENTLAIKPLPIVRKPQKEKPRRQRKQIASMIKSHQNVKAKGALEATVLTESLRTKATTHKKQVSATILGKHRRGGPAQDEAEFEVGSDVEDADERP